MGIIKRFQDHRRLSKLTRLLLDAANRGDTPAVLAILDEGLNVDADDHGATALLMAATDGKYETVEALLRRGANANARDEEHSITTLMQAAASGDVRTVRAVLEAGAEVNSRDWMGRAALDYADGSEIVGLLQRAGTEHGDEASES